MRLEYAAISHVGMRRTVNQDSYVALPEHSVFAVADGMGGHLAGEVASRLAVESLADCFTEIDDDDITWPFGVDPNGATGVERLTVAVEVANHRIRRRSRADASCHRMGTTIVAAMFLDEDVAVAHVGDSRAYRLRAGELERLTEDHSLVSRMRRESPGLDEQDPTLLRYRHIVVRALGMEEQVEVELTRMAAQPGDVYLLCSDGLTTEVDDDGIREILLSERASLQERARRLVDLACELGGHDNVTVLLVAAQRLEDADMSASTAA